MAPKMAPRRQRSERQSAVVPATAEQWFLQLPDGPCKTAMIQFLAEAHDAGDASVDSAMAQCLAYATNLFPEEIVLWGLDGALGPIPWQNASFQRGIRASTLALREMRSEYVDLARQRDALLTEVRALRASEPVQPATFVPFVGTGRLLDEGLSSLD